ncbi:MAG: N-acetylmuramoyl-L-alanine amidase [Gammaproteobacteria bacterium]|jgi:N-acetylmuramoyl-L-alanine amidase
MVSGALFASELTGIRLATGPDATRVVLDLDDAASHRLFELSDPNRVVIDLPDVAASSALKVPAAKGRVRSVRTGARPGGVLRVVLDLSAPADSKSFLLQPDGTSGHRLVIDLSDPGARGAARITANTNSDRDVVIVIDAGHGGHDPGATGDSGLVEKDAVLDIARRLAALVSAAPGMRPVLIRRDDTYVSPEDRVEIARAAQADFFISIHADASENSRVRGATVYSIKPRRAAAEQRQRLANLQSVPDLVGGVRIADQDATVARVLLDLSQNASMSNSIIAGDYMIEQLSRVTPLLRDAVQEGSYEVLTAPDIPSLLIETAFVTNPQDESRLRDPAFRALMAEALYAGLLDYYRTNPPPDTYIALNPPARHMGPVRHVIASGETLSEIAERYRISLRELRRTNRINGDVIRIGQVLTIPTTG